MPQILAGLEGRHRFIQGTREPGRGARLGSLKQQLITMPAQIVVSTISFHKGLVGKGNGIVRSKQQPWTIY